MIEEGLRTALRDAAAKLAQAREALQVEKPRTVETGAAMAARLPSRLLAGAERAVVRGASLRTPSRIWSTSGAAYDSRMVPALGLAA